MTMTAASPGLATIRRSPLAAEHERLGARWISDRAHWPAAYGSLELEREAIGSAAGLSDVGPLIKLSVVARDVAARLRPLGLHDEVGSIGSGTLAGLAVEVWFLAPDEALIVHESVDTAGAAATPAATSAFAALRSAGFAPVELSSGFAAFVLAGPAVQAVLGDCSPIDFHERALADRHLASGPVAGIRTVVGRLDRGGAPSFTLLVARDLAVSLWDSLLEVGAIHGLRPVGAGALSERSA